MKEIKRRKNHWQLNRERELQQQKERDLEKENQKLREEILELRKREIEKQLVIEKLKFKGMFMEWEYENTINEMFEYYKRSQYEKQVMEMGYSKILEEMEFTIKKKDRMIDELYLEKWQK